MLTFHELYVSHAADIHRFAYWLAGDPDEAQEIASETFVRAWTRFASIRTETLKGYLLTIARNVHLERLRKRKSHEVLEDRHADPGSGPEKTAEARDELESVRRLLGTFPEPDRAAFVMRVQHELPYAEIARALGVSEVAAKVKVHRVRKKLLAARMNGRVG